MTTSDQRSSSKSELDPQSNIPRVMSLGAVFQQIMLTPGEIQHFLRDLSANYIGGAHHELGLALRDHADLVADPRTYGWKPQEQPAGVGPRQYTPPTPDSVGYGDQFRKPESGEQISRNAMFNRPAEVPTPTPAGQPVAQQTPPYTTPTATDKPASQADDFEAEARRRGWAPPTQAPRVYSPPEGPDVDPKYRAPYTSPDASDAGPDPQTPPQPHAPETTL